MRSWDGEDWQDLPEGADVLLVDGPGTSHHRASLGYGDSMHHDEYIWMPRIDTESFYCCFSLELKKEPQPGCPKDCGRHGGVAIGVSKAVGGMPLFWANCPRKEMRDCVGSRIFKPVNHRTPF